MTPPWFDPNSWSWLPGTVFGCLTGLWGACAGALGPRGKAKGLVLGFGMALIVAAAVCLVAAAVAYFGGQPFPIWVGLLLPGLQGLFILAPLFPLVRLGYRQAEERKMAARDLEV